MFGIKAGPRKTATNDGERSASRSRQKVARTRHLARRTFPEIAARETFAQARAQVHQIPSLNRPRVAPPCDPVVVASAVSIRKKPRASARGRASIRRQIALPRRGTENLRSLLSTFARSARTGEARTLVSPTPSVVDRGRRCRSTMAIRSPSLDSRRPV